MPPVRRIARTIQRAHGRNLREARTKAKITQAELAAEVGVIQQTVSHWESGRASISDAYKVLIGRALDLDPAELFPLNVGPKRHG